MKKEPGFIDNKLLDKAIEKWGASAQIEMIEEESIELALAIQKLKRKRGDHVKKLLAVIDEIADVKIMIRQAERIFDVEDRVSRRIDFKMRRLKRRIKEGVA